MYISNLLDKLSVQDRTEAAALATRLHLLDDEGERQSQTDDGGEQ
jgi:hypothetical protein